MDTDDVLLGSRSQLECVVWHQARNVRISYSLSSVQPALTWKNTVYSVNMHCRSAKGPGESPSSTKRNSDDKPKLVTTRLLE